MTPIEQLAYQLIQTFSSNKPINSFDEASLAAILPAESDVELEDVIAQVNEWGISCLPFSQEAEPHNSAPHNSAPNNKTYQINSAINLLEQPKIQSALQVPVDVFPVINSTNQYLLDRIRQLEKGQVCTAEFQAQGRGRRARQWLSPFGSNIYLSMYWPLQVSLEQVMGVSLVIGMAAVDALESLGAKDVKLKWPNDVYYKGKKLAGILVESKGQLDDAVPLVIGMGMNVNAQVSTQISQQIDQPWTSLDEVFSGKTPDRTTLIVEFVKSWKKELSQYEQLGMSPFVERWHEVDSFYNQKVKVLLAGEEVHGVMKGIDQQGAALIETEQGVQAFYGNEISLRLRTYTLHT